MAQPGDERVAVALPGMPNVHSHGFQRGMAGLTEYRGPEADNFWSWRELMYRFVARMTPEDVEAITAQSLRGHARGRLHAGRRISLRASRRRRQGRIRIPPRWPRASRPRRRAPASRSRCCPCSMPMEILAAPRRPTGSGASSAAWNSTRGCSRRCREIVAGIADARLGVAPHSLRAVTPPELERVVELAAGSADPHPRGRAGARSRGLRGVVGRATRCNGCWTTRTSTRAGAWCMPRT